MKLFKNHLILAVFFTIWTITFGIWFVVQGNNLTGPILTGISAIAFWSLFIIERIEKKTLQKQKEE